MVNFLLQWLQEQWFLVLFVLKPWLILIMEHGNSERILNELVVVKLFPTLKHVNSQKKFQMIMKWCTGFFYFFILFLRRQIADVFSRA